MDAQHKSGMSFELRRCGFVNRQFLKHSHVQDQAEWIQRRKVKSEEIAVISEETLHTANKQRHRKLLLDS